MSLLLNQSQNKKIMCYKYYDYYYLNVGNIDFLLHKTITIYIHEYIYIVTSTLNYNYKGMIHCLINVL